MQCLFIDIMSSASTLIVLCLAVMLAGFLSRTAYIYSTLSTTRYHSCTRVMIDLLLYSAVLHVCYNARLCCLFCNVFVCLFVS